MGGGWEGEGSMRRGSEHEQRDRGRSIRVMELLGVDVSRSLKY